MWLRLYIAAAQIGSYAFIKLPHLSFLYDFKSGPMWQHSTNKWMVWRVVDANKCTCIRICFDLAKTTKVQLSLLFFSCVHGLSHGLEHEQYYYAPYQCVEQDYF